MQTTATSLDNPCGCGCDFDPLSGAHYEDPTPERNVVGKPTRVRGWYDLPLAEAMWRGDAADIGR